MRSNIKNSKVNNLIQAIKDQKTIHFEMVCGYNFTIIRHDPIYHLWIAIDSETFGTLSNSGSAARIIGLLRDLDAGKRQITDCGIGAILVKV